MFLFRIKSTAALIAALAFGPVVRGGYWWGHHYDDDYYSSDSESSSSSSDSYDYHCDSVAEIACGGDYKKLCHAIEKVGLYNRLDNEYKHWTAFFPSDEAFDELMEQLDVEDIGDIGYRKLKDIILMHFKRGYYLYECDLEERCTYLLEMVNDEYTRTICKNDKEKIYQKGNGNVDDDRPRIIDFDTEACNGVIHTVDGVILPGYMAPESESSSESSDESEESDDCKTITEIVCDDHDFEILCHALMYSDLDDDLDGDQWTLFAPTDDSFKEMMAKFDLDSITDLDKEELTELLLYHVVADEMEFEEIHCEKEVEMAAGGCTITKCNFNNGHKFQKGTCNNRDNYNLARIIEKDVKACNGVIQIVEDVLLPGSFCSH